MMLAAIFEALISIVGLGVIVYGPWQWACTDWARQRMFSARDQLFDLAAAGEIEFDSVSYRSIRSDINNVIRFAHELTWTRLIFFAWTLRQDRPKEPPIYQAIDNITNFAAKQKVITLVEEIEKAAVAMVFLKSPVLIALGVVTIIPLVAGVIAYVCARGFLHEITSSVGNVIQSEASILGRA